MASSSDVEIYTWSDCPYCHRAKALLRQKNVDFVEHSLDGDEAGRDKMALRTGGKRSVPQIFIRGTHIGGCDDLHTLDAAQKLDQMLKSG